MAEAKYRIQMQNYDEGIFYFIEQSFYNGHTGRNDWQKIVGTKYPTFQKAEKVLQTYIKAKNGAVYFDKDGKEIK